MATLNVKRSYQCPPVPASLLSRHLLPVSSWPKHWACLPPSEQSLSEEARRTEARCRHLNGLREQGLSFLTPPGWQHPDQEFSKHELHMCACSSMQVYSILAHCERHMPFVYRLDIHREEENSQSCCSLRAACEGKCDVCKHAHQRRGPPACITGPACMLTLSRWDYAICQNLD